MSNLPVGSEHDINAPWNIDDQFEYRYFQVPFVDECGTVIFYSQVLFCDGVAIDYSDDIETSEFWEECLNYDYKDEFIEL